VANESPDGTSTAVSDVEMLRMRNLGIGCFTTLIGAPSGAMIGVLVAKFVGIAQKCVPLEGLPACNWYVYAIVGAVLGMTTLPTLVLLRLRRGKSAARPTS
jgi:hypothetical protein